MPRVVAVAMEPRLATGKEVLKRAFANVLLPEACGPVIATMKRGSEEYTRSSGSQSEGSDRSASWEMISTGLVGMIVRDMEEND